MRLNKGFLPSHLSHKESQLSSTSYFYAQANSMERKKISEEKINFINDAALKQNLEVAPTLEKISLQFMCMDDYANVDIMFLAQDTTNC